MMLMLCTVMFFQVLVTLVIRSTFISFELVDTPCARKLHTLQVPYCGGLIIWLSFSILVVTQHFSPLINYIYYASTAVCLVSLIDDILHISPLGRLFFQLLIVSLLIYALKLVNVADILIHPHSSDYLLATVVATLAVILFAVGTINSYNMVDGVDGLCSGLSVLSYTTFAYIFIVHGYAQWAVLCLSMLCFSALFMMFNLSTRYKIFLGDNGSAMLGLSIVAILIIMTAKFRLFSPFSSLWFVGCPVMGMLRVIIIRLRHKHSPLQSDRRHFHYLLLDNDASTYIVLAIILFVQVIFCAVGLMFISYQVPGHLSLLAFIATFLAFLYLTYPNQHQQYKLLSIYRYCFKKQ